MKQNFKEESEEVINGTEIRVKKLCIYQKREGQMSEPSLPIAILF